MDQTHDRPAYTYAPLPDRYFIRILELKPSIDYEAPLQSSLQIARYGLDDYPYDAMSYAWGEPVFSQTLYIEATPPNQDSSSGVFHPIGITQNLSKMLRNMRHPLRTRRLWVDAVCINQQDNVEKSDQIPLMYWIYQQASRVVIWLGDNTEDQRRMRLLSIFARRRLRHYGPISAMSPDDLQPAQEAIYRLTEIPWFSRLWVVQEAVVNTDVVLCCGVEEMSLMRLFDIVKNMHSLSEHQPARLQSLLEMEKLWNNHARFQASDISSRRPNGERLLYTDDMIEIHQKHEYCASPWACARAIYPFETSGWCNGERPCPTTDTMERFLHFRCADPRDRVYALSAFQKCMTIVPDYQLSPEQVYHDFASSLRDHGQLQWVLREAAMRRCGEKTPGLPTWVLDLRIRPVRRSIFAKHLEIGREYFGEYTNVRISRWQYRSDAITLTSCYLSLDEDDHFCGSRPREGNTWYDLWKQQYMANPKRHFLRSTRLRFDPWPMTATWRGDSFPDQPEPAEAKAWIKTTLELVWQQFSKRAATVSSGASETLAWNHCIATVASTLVADGAHIGDLHPSTSKEVQELSDAIPGIFKHGEPFSWTKPKGYSQLITACLQELADDTVDQTSMADAFIQLVMITMQGRCFFTCDIDEDKAYDRNRAMIACGIGPSHMQVGDQALLHYMPFWEQTYLMRACGRDEELSLSCFELVGDCYLKEPVAGTSPSMSGNIEFRLRKRTRTIILK